MSGRRKNAAGGKSTGESGGKKKQTDARILRLNDPLLSSDYILEKVFRKDGPSLGVEFDSLPSKGFGHCQKGSKSSHRLCHEIQREVKGNELPQNCDHDGNENPRASKRRKVPVPPQLDSLVCSEKSAPVKKHGMGKGLMTVWRAINPNGGESPADHSFTEPESTVALHTSKTSPKRSAVPEKKPIKQNPLTKKLRKGTKVQAKRKAPIRRRKVEGNNTDSQKWPLRDKCELALEVFMCQDDLEQCVTVVDDEELELRELQAGPEPLACSSHFSTNGLHSCSLCKDLLAKFPPTSISMRLPFYVQPWVSSPDLVKKLFKVFHFIYTQAVMLNPCPFTLDEFAEAFNDKESMLLGKIHLSLLRHLLSDVETELSGGFFMYASKNSKYLELLNSVEHKQHLLKFWKESLTPLTWTEILRQIFFAAGIGLHKGALRKEAHNKEVHCMVKYGLTPGTLKGELFALLSAQGTIGTRVFDLATSSKIMDLNLAGTTYELEQLISSVLSSDITLFEKTSCSVYRLRNHSATKDNGLRELDAEDFGSIDEGSKDSVKYSSDDDSESDSGTSTDSKIKQDCRGNRSSLAIHSEIDESHPGEPWMDGLTEANYSDLNVEEKLSALVALVDLLNAGFSIRMEDTLVPSVECAPNKNQHGGGKIKRSSYVVHSKQVLSEKESDRTSGFHPVDSSVAISKSCQKALSCSRGKDEEKILNEDDLHPMQSIFLGSDRRYNRYWLFLGPCNAYDPGHKRIYFESSEDGHWEVIDSEEALCSLLSALDCRGMREAQLLVSLKKREAALCREMSMRDIEIRELTSSENSEISISREDSSSAVSEVDNNICLGETGIDISASSGTGVLECRNREEHQRQKWSRLQAFDGWIWNSFYSDLNAVKFSKKSYLDSLARCESCHDLYWRDEKHCKICHTTFELDFDLEERYTIHIATCREDVKTDMFPKHKVLSSQLQVLKAAAHAIESVMPEGALVGGWTKSAHKLWIKRLRRTSTLAEFMQVVGDFVDAINKEWWQTLSYSMEEIVGSFATTPQTLSAVALWLLKLDSLLAPHIQSVVR